MSISKQQSGFTLIELVVVIVILGILAATALPKFVNFSAQAEDAAAEGVAGAIASGMSINAAACAADNAGCVAVTTDCTAANVGLVLQGGVPAGFTIGGTTVNCTVTKGTGGSASFVAIAAVDPTPPTP